jgi:hypothetical protein
MERNTRSPATPNSSLPLASLAFWALAAPCLVAAVTYAGLHRLESPVWQFETVPIYLLFIAEIALLGYGLACGVSHRGWRWGVYCWLLLLINLLLFAHQSFAGWRASVVLRSLWAAQVGTLIVWAVLGAAPVFYWRYPLAALVALPAVALAFTGGRWWAWQDVGVRIAGEWLLLALVTAALRGRGYRIARTFVTSASSHHATKSGEELRANQFGVRHLLIWMTSVSLLLAVAKALDLFRVVYAGSSGWGDWLDAVVSGAALCLALLIALWAALGEGSAWLRWSACLLATPALGLALEAWDRWVMRMGPSTPWNYVWTIWASLAGAMLVALLTIVRGEGQRLVRLSASKSSAS